MAHCGRGDEVLVGAEAHTYVHEGGGAAVLGSIQPQPLPHEPDGTIALERIEAAIKPADDHYARTRLLSLEQTIGGRVVPLKYLKEATALAKRKGLTTHLDGARLFNAAVKLGVGVDELAAGFDTVSVCLSKGLGAPTGSVLAGEASLIKEARHWRKLLGGGMRQVGILAAAGRYALEHHVARLAEDHANAARMAGALAKALDVQPPDSNILWIRNAPPNLVPRLAERGVLATGSRPVRLVTHLDVTAAQCDEAAKIIVSLC
jgi:threonine aldolase